MVESSPIEDWISRSKVSEAGRSQRRLAELTLERVEPSGASLRESRKVTLFSAASCLSP